MRHNMFTLEAPTVESQTYGVYKSRWRASGFWKPQTYRWKIHLPLQQYFLRYFVLTKKSTLSPLVHQDSGWKNVYNYFKSVHKNYVYIQHKILKQNHKYTLYTNICTYTQHCFFTVSNLKTRHRHWQVCHANIVLQIFLWFSYRSTSQKCVQNKNLQISKITMVTVLF